MHRGIGGRGLRLVNVNKTARSILCRHPYGFFGSVNNYRARLAKLSSPVRCGRLQSSRTRDWVFLLLLLLFFCTVVQSARRTWGQSSALGTFSHLLVWPVVTVSCPLPSYRIQASSWQKISQLFVFVLYVAWKKRISSKIDAFCFVLSN